MLVRDETPTTEPVHGLRLSPGMETEIQLPFREPGIMNWELHAALVSRGHRARTMDG